MFIPCCTNYFVEFLRMHVLTYFFRWMFRWFHCLVLRNTCDRVAVVTGSRTLLRYVRLIVCLSVVCLSCVTLLHPKLELLGNIFAPPNCSVARRLCIKILSKNSGGSKVSCTLSTREYKKLPFSTNILLWKWYMIRPSYNGRRIGTRMRSIEWCHFQWPWVTPNLDFKVTIFWTSSN